VNADAYREQFPITSTFSYLDHAGIAPVSRGVQREIERFLSSSAGSGAFDLPEWLRMVERTRGLAARIVNAGSDEIAFVRSTSHGLSIVAAGLDWSKGDNVLVYEKEFPANLFPWMHLKQKGVEVRLFGSTEGRIDPRTVAEKMDGRTRLVSISSVQFTTGYRVDLERLGGLCRERDVLLCVDAIQSLGVLPMDVKRFNIDFLAADAHKWLLGPEGIGIFFCGRELAGRLDPPLVGWRSVRNELAFEEPVFELRTDGQRFEEGSLNLAGIAGLGAALELLFAAGIGTIEKRVQDLGDDVIREAEARRFSVMTPKDRRERGGIVTIKGPFDSQRVRDGLRERGIMVNVRAGGLRISPHFYNTTEEIGRCFSAIDSLLAT
jgi:selenocysteine lyase/cysteine desulfurase